MTPDRTTLIGRVLEPVTYTIREDDIQDYLPVAGEEQAAFLSDEKARAGGYERRVIPPSFARLWRSKPCCGLLIGSGIFCSTIGPEPPCSVSRNWNICGLSTWAKR